MLQKQNKYKERLREVLSDTFDERELSNIIDYYFDAIAEVDDLSFESHLVQLENGWPIQYVTQVSFFYGYQFFVDNRVLIPRAETEELVYWVEQDIKGYSKSILDIGTGSGCILLSLLKKNSYCRGTGLDVSRKAIEVFKINQKKLEVKAASIVGDILSSDCTNYIGKFDVIISNPPYILPSEKNRMGHSVIAKEPHLALFVDSDDPLIFYKKIIQCIDTHLNDRGVLYFETSDLYHEELKAYLDDLNYEGEFRKDMQGNWRMLKITKN